MSIVSEKQQLQQRLCELEKQERDNACLRVNKALEGWQAQLSESDVTRIKPAALYKDDATAWELEILPWARAQDSCLSVGTCVKFGSPWNFQTYACCVADSTPMKFYASSREALIPQDLVLLTQYGVRMRLTSLRGPECSQQQAIERRVEEMHKQLARVRQQAQASGAWTNQRFAYVGLTTDDEEEEDQATSPFWAQQLIASLQQPPLERVALVLNQCHELLTELTKSAE